MQDNLVIVGANATAAVFNWCFFTIVLLMRQVNSCGFGLYDNVYDIMHGQYSRCNWEN